MSTGERETERTTFMIDIKVKDELEDKWLWLRRKLKGYGITKSGIVEEALKMALEDLKTKKESSKIFKRLSRD